MNRVNTALLTTLTLAAGLTGYARAQTELTSGASSLRTNVEILAADALEGRFTGSDGIRLAADHIIGELRAIGAQPIPGGEGYRLPFQYTGRASDGGTRLEIVGESGTRSWNDPDLVRGLSFSESAEVTGPLVFAGYGLVVPETDGFSYDSYATLDVTDKIVLVLRYFPEDSEGDLRALFSRYAGLRFKASAARQRGAKGLLVVTGPRSPNAGALVRMTADTAAADSGIAGASITARVADALFEHVPARTLEDAQGELDSGNPHVAGFDMPVEVTLDARVTREQHTGYNVVGYLPPTTAGSVDKPYVMLGAHYDHLGRGESGDSLAGAEEAGEIHNGADDNASGVAAVLAAAGELADQERRRGVILALWSGEELGLLGSADFVDSSPVAMSEVAAYVNFDMVGRMRDNELTVQALGSSSVWPELVDDLNESFGFDLQRVNDPYLPTDAMSLHLAGVPSLALFTGSHEDYHRPSDDTETVNFTDLDRVARYGAAVAAHLIRETTAPDFIDVEREPQQGQAMMRVSTGTIPDYSSEVEGLLLSGVMAGGPAEAAGLQEGDIIVTLAGHAVGNIYDYMFALDLLRVGEPSSVIFLRNGERLETELVPMARP
ncbi:MAG: M20/M25/M40 family metallo-hydrolase [Acidobacteriota bacterium]|nr:M20/M25/M40 family metallo-hydrolase [Acidobacteriota bacterium]